MVDSERLARLAMEGDSAAKVELMRAERRLGVRSVCDFRTALLVAEAVSNPFRLRLLAALDVHELGCALGFRWIRGKTRKGNGYVVHLQGFGFGCRNSRHLNRIAHRVEVAAAIALGHVCRACLRSLPLEVAT